MTNKTDLRVVKSKYMIKKAFLALIEEKGYNSTTIKDIAQKALISRKTFYFHYDTKDSLYAEITDEALSIFKNNSYLEEVIASDAEFQLSLIIKILDIIKKQRNIYKILINDPSNKDFYNKLKQLLTDFIINQSNLIKITEQSQYPLELLQEVYSSIFMQIIIWWINQNEVSSSDAIKIMFSLFSDDLLDILGIKKNLLL
jgi:AcrR family transcriptional regulator